MTIKDKLIKRLLKLPDTKTASGNREIVTMCPFCKDTHKTPKFYINIDDPDVIKVHCFHGSCTSTAKILTAEIVHMLGIDDPEIDSYLNSLNNSGTSKIKTTANIDRNFIFPTKPKESDMLKIKYSSDRTGIDFSLSENIKNYKMIYNLNEFCNINNIKLHLNEYQLADLSNCWIGFLSFNNNTINLRNVNSQKTDKRYMNIKINQDIKYPFLYIPPQKTDLLTKAPTIVLAEGAYDIICIKNRFYTKDTTNAIFAAVGSSSSYNTGITKAFSLSCFFDAEIYIYGDQDVPIDFYYKKFSRFMKTNKFTIIRNKNNKDFGNINESYAFDIKKLN